MKLDPKKFFNWLDEPPLDIAVLLPTRGRKEALLKSVMSLVDKADNIQRVQFVLGLDRDDEDTMEYVKNVVFAKLSDVGIQGKMLAFDRLGYARLNEYVNTLARHSDAKWLMFWNDDAIMETQGWDTEIMKFQGQFVCLRMLTHNQHPYAIFPIVPVEWFRLMGYLSPHQISDAWLSQTAYLLGIMRNLPVEVLHDRHDLTGNNNDETYKERIMFEGRPDDPRDFNHMGWRERRVQDCIKLAWFIKHRGEDVSWFENVLRGKQEAWSYMISAEQDPNSQLKRFAEPVQ